MSFTKKKLVIIHILSALAACVLGFLFHNAYEAFSHASWISFFVPINESIWEHTKLIFFPVIFLSIIESLVFRSRVLNLLWTRSVGCLTGVFFIPTFYYTYTGIWGKHSLFMDILDFILSVLLCYYISYKLVLKGKEISSLTKFLTYGAVLIFLLLYILFTLHAPEYPFFQSP